MRGVWWYFESEIRGIGDGTERKMGRGKGDQKVFEMGRNLDVKLAVQMVHYLAFQEVNWKVYWMGFLMERQMEREKVY